MLQEHPAERIGRVVHRAAERELDTAGERELAKDVPRVGHRAGERGRAWATTRVSPARTAAKGLVQTGPRAAGASEPLVEVDPIVRDVKRGQAWRWAVRSCGQSGAPGVADDSPSVSSPSFKVPIRYTRRTTLTETAAEVRRGPPGGGRRVSGGRSPIGQAQQRQAPAA